MSQDQPQQKPCSMFTDRRSGDRRTQDIPITFDDRRQGDRRDAAKRFNSTPWWLSVNYLDGEPTKSAPEDEPAPETDANQASRLTA